jgi:hypothetical protein
MPGREGLGDFCRDSSGLRRNAPQSSKPFVSSGLEITRGKTGEFGHGTASLIVRKKGVSTGVHALTCAHVLGPVAIDATNTRNVVYCPHLKECLGIECNRPFGKVVDTTLPAPGQNVVAITLGGTEVFAVDAALIELVADSDAENTVPEVGPIQSVRDLVQEWNLKTPPQSLELPPARQLTVRKFGATTNQTHGTIRRLKREPLQAGRLPTGSDPLVLEIEVNPGEKPFSAEYELDMARYKSRLEIETTGEIQAQFKNTNIRATIGGSTATPTLKLQGVTFSQPGDSGAPIVDDNNNIVAILRSGTLVPVFVSGRADPVEIGTGNSQGLFIAAAFAQLQVDFLPAGQHTAGAPIIVPGMAIAREPHDAVDWAELDRVRRRIEADPEGERLAELARRHFDEVRQLIHHSRRVKVTWQRHKGPGFLAAFLRAGQRPVPREIGGVKLCDAARAMRDVLVAEGSPALRAAILKHGEALVRAAEGAASLEQLVALWGEAQPCSA